MARTNWTKKKRKLNPAPRVTNVEEELRINEEEEEERVSSTVGDGDGEDIGRTNEAKDKIDSPVENENEEEEEEDKNEGDGENEEEEENNKGDGEDEVESEANSESNSDGGEEMDGDDEHIAIPPLGMYFQPTEYKKKIKLSTRCYVDEVLTTLENLKPPLSDVEKNWLHNHPQFRYIFHLPRDKNHKVMGMWMLLLRTAVIDKKKEVWFVVNGVPIRYGIKEHALISGLNCRNYPLDYEKIGSNEKIGSKEFVQKYFESNAIRREDVKQKLMEMEPVHRCRDRVRMALLYFLSSIVKAPTKTGAKAPNVDNFLQRAVSDLNFCKTFPWGRYSFDHMLGSIKHTMDHFGGAVTEGILWPISGFCIPLELLPFEAIPQLRNLFVEDKPGGKVDCPRMCKRQFKKSATPGFPFSEINNGLGTTKDIDSILEPADDEENDLLNRITEKEDIDDEHDPVVNSWMERMRQGHTVRFEEMFNEDVQSRVVEEPENMVDEEIPPVIEGPGNPNLVDLLNTFKLEMEEKMNVMEEKMNVIVDRLDVWDARVAPLEAFVKEQLLVNSKGEGQANQGDKGIADPKALPKPAVGPSKEAEMRVTRSKTH